jgi:hypothetical protein
VWKPERGEAEAATEGEARRGRRRSKPSSKSASPWSEEESDIIEAGEEGGEKWATNGDGGPLHGLGGKLPGEVAGGKGQKALAE